MDEYDGRERRFHQKDPDEVPGWDGEERRVKDTEVRHEPIHPMRWTALTIWIIAFTIVVALGMRSLQDQQDDLKRQSATIAQLQKTNCSLRTFLLSAEARNRVTAEDPAINEATRKANLRAANGYHQLAAVITATGPCPRAKEIEQRIINGKTDETG